ncbi:Bacterial type II and III secretion system protein [Sulfidibacter corallicola]|uniref:Type II secretion system protein D (GspD) n=1 Tax=Sulfidibacter corallicola TaxID=2818388 RepID=A0A8A4TW18_SULCO|nr:secretin N-terminal domain-containing protein [Sulfidibacter corallicola]QTD53368.1 hypothetical protein J3U87_13015 [Sulfidibacter corallicola]
MDKAKLFRNRYIVPALVCLALITAGCQKKQDLIEKAFAGKTFDNRLDRDVNQTDAEQPEVEDDTDSKTSVEVLVDNLKEPAGSSVYLKTGDETPPEKPLFEHDPEAPAIKLEEAQLYDLIDILCQQLHTNYIIDPSVKDQTITIGMVEGDTKMKTSELFDLLLKLHDLTMVRRDNFLFIVPIASPDVNPGLELLFGSRPNPNLRREELAIQIIPLKYIKPSEMATILKDFMSPSARVLEEPRNNLLVLIDKYQYIAKIMELIPTFDVDVLQNKRLSFYELAHVDAVETAEKMKEILAVYGYDEENERLSMIPIETLNGILVVANSGEIFKELDYWVKKFDQEAQYEEESVFVYHVEYTTADSIASSLSQLFGFQTAFGGSGRAASPISQRRTTNPGRDPSDLNNRSGRTNNRDNRTDRNNPDPNRGLAQNTNLQNRGNIQQGEGPVMIVDIDNNSLIFQTTPREYARVLKTVRKLDILPRQVFLEVTVLSVELNDTFRLGINWSGEDNEGGRHDVDAGFGAVATGLSSSGFSTVYSYSGATASIKASLDAAKTKGYANVLQQPHIMAIDNQPANISVGTDVPIATTTTNINSVGTGNATTPASSSTIQYRETGVSLGFTPHINANGVIRLEISLDISSAGAQDSSAEAVPISQNTLETEMIVRDGQTIVMGGLIFDQEDWGKDSVPLLDRIPLLRHLVTKRRNTKAQSELIVMITPRLIDSEEKSIEISKEFKDKILNEFKNFKRSKY